MKRGSYRITEPLDHLTPGIINVVQPLLFSISDWQRGARPRLERPEHASSPHHREEVDHYASLLLAVSIHAEERSMTSPTVQLDAIRQYIHTHCPYANLLDNVSIDADEEGNLCLSGSVRSYYLRQVAVSFVLKAARHKRVSDQLRVID